MRPSVFGNVLCIAVSCGLLIGGAAADTPPEPLDEAMGSCDWECDQCWCGTIYENNCDDWWAYDDECDCGCQKMGNVNELKTIADAAMLSVEAHHENFFSIKNQILIVSSAGLCAVILAWLLFMI